MRKLIGALTVAVAMTVSAQAAAMDHVYELLAAADEPGLSELSIADKRVVLDGAIDLIAHEVDRTGGASVAVGTNGRDRVPFPPVDFDMDGNPDEVGHMLEVSFRDDSALLNATEMAQAIALPWTVVAYTDGDTVNIVIGVPETFVRLYFRGAENIDELIEHGESIHGRLRRIVRRALEGEGFDTGLDFGLPGTEMGEDEIARVEGMFGPITSDFVAPETGVEGATVEEVVAAIEAAFRAPSVPDLNGDGVMDARDYDVLPGAFGDYIMGAMSFEMMAGMMGMGMDLWSWGLTFQQWAVPRTLDLSSASAGRIYVIELCQPFYAGTALSTGLHHMPSMPCAVAVWEEDGVVRVSILSPEFIFAYFFADAGPEMSTAMQQLFAVFPTFVYNEMVGVVNNALAPIDASAALPFHNFPSM